MRDDVRDGPAGGADRPPDSSGSTAGPDRLAPAGGGLLFDLVIERDPGLDLAAPRVFRHAVRGVALEGGRLLMIRSAVEGDWKFPGGGVEPGESPEAALVREIAEETGYRDSAVGPLLGTARELRRPREAGFGAFEMRSDYYLVRLAGPAGERSLDPYEEELAYEPRRVEPGRALAENRALLEEGKGGGPWVRREALVLEAIAARLAGTAAGGGGEEGEAT